MYEIHTLRTVDTPDLTFSVKTTHHVITFEYVPPSPSTAIKKFSRTRVTIIAQGVVLHQPADGGTGIKQSSKIRK